MDSRDWVRLASLNLRGEDIMRILLAAALALLPAIAEAHPGGLAADGCHNDRQRGGRHCHRAPGGGETRRDDRARFASEPRSGRSVYYANCSAARAAGAAPVRRGDPGYAPHLDRDGDGVGCE